MTEIEKGIPIPKGKMINKHEGIWLWLKKLEVGDSVLIMQHPSSVSGAIQSWYRHNRHTEIRFTTKAEGAGCRVWRTL